MCGFASSIFKRGLNFVNVPTTLLSQVDSAIGGKTGVNHEIYGKNLIGSFYHPNVVIADTEYLKSLSKKELIDIMNDYLNYYVTNLLFDDKLSEFESCLSTLKIDMELVE